MFRRKVESKSAGVPASEKLLIRISITFVIAAVIAFVIIIFDIDGKIVKQFERSRSGPVDEIVSTVVVFIVCFAVCAVSECLRLKKEADRHEKTEERLLQINDIFGSLNKEPEQNIQTILAGMCSAVGGVCALYNRLEDKENSLYTWAGYNLPEGYERSSEPIGHICYEATIKGGNKPVVLNDLEGTEWEESDPNVKRYDLKAYLGYPVRLEGKPLGSLCIVDVKKRAFTSTDIHIISALAKGIEVEEERKRVLTASKQAVEDKDAMIREVHHRVKNNLAMISSLINLKAAQINEGEELEDLEHQVDAIRLVHEKLYQNEDISEVSMRGYIQELLATVFGSFYEKPVTIENQIENIVLTPKTAVAVGLIINEIATNAIKYGFRDDSEPRFSVTMVKEEEKHRYLLTASNNGSPFPEEIDFASTNTLGLQLIQTLVEQLDGTVDLRKRPYPLFTIIFPIVQYNRSN